MPILLILTLRQLSAWRCNRWSWHPARKTVYQFFIFHETGRACGVFCDFSTKFKSFLCLIYPAPIKIDLYSRSLSSSLDISAELECLIAHPLRSITNFDRFHLLNLSTANVFPVNLFYSFITVLILLVPFFRCRTVLLIRSFKRFFVGPSFGRSL